MKTLYFNWLYSLVYDKRYFKGFSYKKLLRHLHKIDFVFTIPVDDNRAADGENLRWRFGYENGCDSAAVQALLDCRPCSVLEMMAALAVRCEEHIMGDPEIGNRTGLWFWCMLQNLYLDRMYDSHYDEKYVDEVISKFLNREYEPDGEGGLFTVRNCDRDLRSMEIWSQMCLYLNQVVRSSDEEPIVPLSRLDGDSSP